MGGTRPLVVHHGEVDELFVDEVRVRDLRHRVVHEQIVLLRSEGFRTSYRKTIFIGLMTSDYKLQASREGSK